MIMPFLNTGMLKYFNTTEVNTKKDSAILTSKNNVLKTDYNIALQANLKQLEFISRLELHLDNSLSHLYSIKFLQELNNVKLQAQNNTLQSINFCK